MKRILVLRTDRLGDLVLCSGYLAALAEAWPDSHIDLYLAQETIPAEQILSPALHVHAVPFDRQMCGGDQPVLRWLREMDERKYDALIVPQFSLGYPEVLALAYSQIPKRWGFANADPGLRSDWLELRFGPPHRDRAVWITDGPTVQAYAREVDKYRILAEAQGVHLPVEPRLFVRDIGVRKRKEGFLVWPGCGSEVRRWPADRFAAAATLLANGPVTVGATEPESWIARDVKDHLSRNGVGCNIEVRDATRLSETARWLAAFETVLANDTGIAHLAAAVGCRVISVSSSQHQGRFSVYSDRSVTIFADAPCRRCDGLCLFDESVFPCVSSIEATAVAQAVQSLERGQTEVLLPTRQFVDADQTFDKLQAGRVRLAEVLHQREFALERDLQAARAALGQAEAGLSAAKAVLSELETDRSKWRTLCQQAEEQRDNWESLCHEAEVQRDQLSELQVDAEERLRIAARFEERCCEFEALFPWLRSDSALGEARLWPKISVITPSFRQGRFIEETIQSVLAQNYPNFEHIVIDAGSDDDTASIVAKYPHVRWVCEPDRGQAHAINKGLLMATGVILAYLNSDDVYRPGAFAAVASEFLANPSARMIVGNCDYIDECSRTTGVMKAQYSQFEDLVRYWGWGKWYCIPQPAVFWRKDLLAESGLFNVQWQMVLDYDMWLRMARITQPHIIDRTLAAFRLSADTKTVSRTHVMYEEELSASRRHWSVLPRPRRIQIAALAYSHFSRKLLDVSEHLALSSQQTDIAQQLILKSALRWPPVLFSPRAILTALQLATWRFERIRTSSQRIHRAYLGLKWRLQSRKRA